MQDGLMWILTRRLDLKANLGEVARYGDNYLHCKLFSLRSVGNKIFALKYITYIPLETFKSRKIYLTTYKE